MVLDQFTVVGEGLLVRAPAKINLGLLISGKRDDGFHGIETIMAKVDWYDELLIERKDSDGIDFRCHGRHWAPDGAENLAWRAAMMLMDHASIDQGLRITLNKSLPVGAGLGGGSSDAAAVLMGVNKLLNLDVEVDILAGIASSLGSDIPFFLAEQAAFCRGRGEEIVKFSEKTEFSAVLFLPDISVSTGEVYGNYKHDEQVYLNLHLALEHHVLENRIDLDRLMCENMLACSCFNLHPELKQLSERIEALGYGDVFLSGSGSTLYSLVDDAFDLDEFRSALESSVDCEFKIVNSNRW